MWYFTICLTCKFQPPSCPALAPGKFPVVILWDSCGNVQGEAKPVLRSPKHMPYFISFFQIFIILGLNTTQLIRKIHVIFPHIFIFSSHSPSCELSSNFGQKFGLSMAIESVKDWPSMCKLRYQYCNIAILQYWCPLVGLRCCCPSGCRKFIYLSTHGYTGTRSTGTRVHSSTGTGYQYFIFY